MDKELRRLLRRRAAAIENGDVAHEHNICIETAECFMKYDDMGRAITTLKEAILLQKSILAHRLLGDAYSRLSQFDAALAQYHEQLSMSIEESQPHEQQRAHTNMGNAHYGLAIEAPESQSSTQEDSQGSPNHEQLSRAVEHYTKALDLAKTIHVKPRERTNMLARCYINLGNVCLTLDSHDSRVTAVDHYQSAFNLSLQLGDFDLQVLAASNLSEAQLNVNRLEDAIATLNHAATANIKNADPESLISLKSLIAEVLLEKKNDTHAAIFVLRAAIKDLKKNRNSVNRATATRLAKIIRQTKHVRSVERSIATLAERHSTNENVAIALFEFAGDLLCDCKPPQFSTAAGFYQRAFEAAKHAGAPRRKCSDLAMSMAMTFLDLKLFRAAIEAFTNELEYRDVSKRHLRSDAFLQRAVCFYRLFEETGEREHLASAESDILEVISIGCVNFEKFEEYNTLVEQLRERDYLHGYIDLPSPERFKSDEDEPDSAALVLSNLNIKIDQITQRVEQMESGSGSNFSPFTEDEQKAVQKASLKLDRRNEMGETQLQTAAKNGQLHLVQKLLNEGARINTQDFAGWTPLHDAVSHGHHDVVDALLQHPKINVNIKSFDGTNCLTALHEAVEEGDMLMTTMLLAQNADALMENKSGDTPLDVAAENGYEDLFQALIESIPESKRTFPRDISEYSSFMERKRSSSIQPRASRKAAESALSLMTRDSQDYYYKDVDDSDEDFTTRITLANIAMAHVPDELLDGKNPMIAQGVRPAQYMSSSDEEVPNFQNSHLNDLQVSTSKPRQALKYRRVLSRHSSEEDLAVSRIATQHPVTKTTKKPEKQTWSTRKPFRSQQPKRSKILQQESSRNESEESDDCTHGREAYSPSVLADSPKLSPVAPEWTVASPSSKYATRLVYYRKMSSSRISCHVVDTNDKIDIEFEDGCFILEDLSTRFVQAYAATFGISTQVLRWTDADGKTIQTVPACDPMQDLVLKAVLKQPNIPSEVDRWNQIAESFPLASISDLRCQVALEKISDGAAFAVPSPLGCDATLALLNVLRYSLNLIKLDLCNCPISKYIPRLRDQLWALPHLEELSLANTFLQGPDLLNLLLCRAPKGSARFPLQRLELLDVSLNPLGELETKFASVLLSKCPNIKKLLCANSMIPNAVFDAFNDFKRSDVVPSRERQFHLPETMIPFAYKGPDSDPDLNILLDELSTRKLPTTKLSFNLSEVKASVLSRVLNSIILQRSNMHWQGCTISLVLTKIVFDCDITPESIREQILSCGSFIDELNLSGTLERLRLETAWSELGVSYQANLHQLLNGLERRVLINYSKQEKYATVEAQLTAADIDYLLEGALD